MADIFQHPYRIIGDFVNATQKLFDIAVEIENLFPFRLHSERADWIFFWEIVLKGDRFQATARFLEKDTTIPVTDRARGASASLEDTLPNAMAFILTYFRENQQEFEADFRAQLGQVPIGQRHEADIVVGEKS